MASVLLHAVKTDLKKSLRKLKSDHSEPKESPGTVLRCSTVSHLLREKEKPLCALDVWFEL